MSGISKELVDSIEVSEKSERGIKFILLISGLSATIFIFFIILFLILNGAPAFQKIGFTDFLFGMEWHPTHEPAQFGVFPIIISTLLVTLGAMVIAIPIGLGCAIFISQLAPSRLKRFLKTAIELLAGVPSIVYGFFGLLILTQWLRDGFGLLTGTCWLAGSLILAIMALPTIITIAEDAITAVPQTYSEASLAMGATKWQTINRVLIPSARSGIITAVILGIGRAIGETMAVMLVTGAGHNAEIPIPILNIFAPMKPITATLAMELGEVSWQSTHYNALFALAIILFILVLIINSVAIFLIRRRKKRHNNSGKSKAAGDIRSITEIIRSSVKPATYILLITAILWMIWEPLNIALTPVVSILILLSLAIGIYFLTSRVFKISPLYGLAVICFFWVFWTWYGLTNALLIVTIGVCAILVFKFLLTPKMVQYFAYSLMTMCVIFTVLALGTIISFIVGKGAAAISWEFLTSTPSDVGRAGGIFPAIIGTIFLAGGALLYAGILGVLAGIFLAEYSKEGKLKEFVRAGMDNLNGTPSIVFGMFGFAFFVVYLNFGVCLLAGQLSLAMMILPTITRTTEEAIRAVPDPFREGSLALGATKWQTTYKVVLPTAGPGIITGLVLGLGRAIGETAPILFTATVFSQRFITLSPFDPVMSLPTHLYNLAVGVPNSETNAYGTALVLIMLVIFFYGIAMFMRRRYSRFKTW